MVAFKTRGTGSGKRLFEQCYVKKRQFLLGRASLKVPKENKSEKMIRFTYIGCRSTPPGFPPGPNPSPLLQVWNSRSDSDYQIASNRITMTIKISKQRPSWSGDRTKSSRSWSSHSPAAAAWPEDQVFGDSKNVKYVRL